MQFLSYLSSRLSSFGSLIALSVCGVVFAALFYRFSRVTSALTRASWRWFVGVLLIAAALAVNFWLPRRYPPLEILDPALPGLFLDYFWAWVDVLALATLVTGIALARSVRTARAPAGAATSESETGEPAVDAAWKEIRFRLDQAQIDLPRQHVYLLLSPHEDWSEALVRSAGVPLFAHAPEGPAPIHAHATGDGVLLSCTGASAFGTQDVQGAVRLEKLCRQLLALGPECPVVRGIVVLFPISWAVQPESVKWAAAVRDDLGAIRRALKIRCPVFALLVQMEDAPGFLEFIERMPRESRASRVGFSVPSSTPFSGDLVYRGLTWMSGWFHNWILDRMSADPLDQPGNNDLINLINDVRLSRKRLRAILEAAFSTHRDAEPVLFRGCYFTATGTGPGEQAFSAGLLRGSRGRVIADHLATEWADEAREDDRWYQWMALVVGLGGALLTLLTWLYIIGVTQNPWWWIGLIAVVIVWIIAIVRLIYRA
jgi:type VI secretion system protein ImpL